MIVPIISEASLVLFNEHVVIYQWLPLNQQYINGLDTRLLDYLLKVTLHSFLFLISCEEIVHYLK